MEIISGSIQGWALLDPEGLIRWDTFITSVPPSGLGYIRVYKIACNCDNNRCGEWMYNYTPESTYYSEDFTFDTGGDITINFDYGTIPTKFTILQNGTEVFTTGYGGLTSYQAALDYFLNAEGLPPETMNPSPPSSTTITVASGDIITAQVICIAPPKASYRYMVGCIGGAVNCVVSGWGAWSDYFVALSGDEGVCRTRERTITTPPSGGGNPCPPLSESECETYEAKNIKFELRTASDLTRNLTDIVFCEGDPGQTVVPNNYLNPIHPLTATCDASPYMSGVKFTDDANIFSTVEVRDNNNNLLYSTTYTGTLDVQFNILVGTGFFNPITININ